MPKTRKDQLSAAPFREAFLASGLSAADLARSLGWYVSTKKNIPDGPRVTRVLGLRGYGHTDRKDGNFGDKSISYENAVRMCDALDLSYTDYGV